MILMMLPRPVKEVEAIKRLIADYTKKRIAEIEEGRNNVR